MTGAVLGTGVTGGGTPNLVTTPEKFRALIAQQRAVRARPTGHPGTVAGAARLPAGDGR
jgi:hypothetical protein